MSLEPRIQKPSVHIGIDLDKVREHYSFKSAY